MALAFFTLCAFFLLLALHPFITYPLSLYLLRKRYQQPVELLQTNDSTIAICVCAYNEEAIIKQKAENLLALQRALPQLEIHIYVDGATDNTARILDAYKDNIHLHVSEERHGKTYGMNLLVAQTSAAIVAFTDANVMIDVESFPLLLHYFSDPTVGCVCGHLLYVNAQETITAANGSLYWRMEENIKQLESDTGSVMGADGSLFAIRRALHIPPPANILDDMVISLNILCSGYRIVRAPDVLAFEASATCAREEYKRKVRISCMAFNAHRLLWPRLRDLSAFNLYKYVSHKLLRWFAIYWLILACLCFEAGCAVVGVPAAGLTIAVLSLGALMLGTYFNITPLSQIANIVSALAATGLGVIHSLKGEQFKTWTPAASIRASAHIAQG